MTCVWLFVLPICSNVWPRRCRQKNKYHSQSVAKNSCHWSLQSVAAVLVRSHNDSKARPKEKDCNPSSNGCNPITSAWPLYDQGNVWHPVTAKILAVLLISSRHQPDKDCSSTPQPGLCMTKGMYDQEMLLNQPKPRLRQLDGIHLIVATQSPQPGLCMTKGMYGIQSLPRFWLFLSGRCWLFGDPKVNTSLIRIAPAQPVGMYGQGTWQGGNALR